MVAALLLVVVACVASLANEALGECVNASWGDPTIGTAMVLDPVTVQFPNVTEVTVKLPVQRHCLAVAAKASFCNATKLSFIAPLIVLVQQDEESNVPDGVLHSVAYCTT